MVLPFVPVPLEGLSVLLPGDSVSHSIAFLFPKKKSGQAHTRERQRHKDSDTETKR